MLHVDDPRKLLDSVQQEVAFLYGFLILPILTVRPEEREREMYQYNMMLTTCS